MWRYIKILHFRFEKLNLECLHLDERYLETMLMFQAEIEVLRDRYNEERQAPSVPRNMPPVSGRIMWIRHFYKRIEEPMEIFKTKPRVRLKFCIKMTVGKRIIFSCRLCGIEKYKSVFNYSMRCPLCSCNMKTYTMMHGMPLLDR